LRCGGREDVAEATRRRRRIPRAGFFVLFRGLRQNHIMGIARRPTQLAKAD
jgi:hypothetical protein